jgi:hypothetical protein
MKNLELVKSAKIVRLPKNDINLNVQNGINFGGFILKSKIVYDDSIYFCNLEKEDMLSIIEEKKSVMAKVFFDGKKFAMQRNLTESEFDFVIICDQKRISRNANII